MIPPCRATMDPIVGNKSWSVFVLLTNSFDVLQKILNAMTEKEASISEPHETKHFDKASEAVLAWMPGPGLTVRPKRGLGLRGSDVSLKAINYVSIMSIYMQNSCKYNAFRTFVFNFR
ncbi:MAG: hypothetical protein AMK69_09940 [Nitrospira bacterium SG8_3]|jgi:hypothetical protein|nr:MAG: hypothetical protein AMK69_09940 [Nitrospira bacterium SG8_3]